MLAEPEISESSRMFIFVSWWKISCWKKKWLLSATQVHVCQHYNWYVKNRKSYIPECFWVFFNWNLFKASENLLAWLHFLFSSGCESFVRAKVLVSLKYKNILLLQDVISVLGTLKYFKIFSLLLAEVLYSFCIISGSRLSGNNYEFSYFPNVWQNICLKRAWEMENHHC